ncbi:hypothetical protein, partial [Clavibacter michiganensis]|uniref:hypothetical protein n=1 Tax=Clavibacter michiganensis TaxID=28447 RepID=UPI0029310684
MKSEPVLRLHGVDQEVATNVGQRRCVPLRVIAEDVGDLFVVEPHPYCRRVCGVAFFRYQAELAVRE